jgi:hypothetical protein
MPCVVLRENSECYRIYPWHSAIGRGRKIEVGDVGLRGVVGECLERPGVADQLNPTPPK